jgi:hypothetical protein
VTEARVPITPIVLLQLLGCDAFHKAFSSLDGISQSTVVQGAVMAVELPDDDRIAPLLEGTDFAPGVAVTAFIADASSVTDLANAPISNALVTVDGNVSETIPSQGSGLYASDPSSSDLVYEDGGSWTLGIDVGGDPGLAALALPAAASFDVPQTHGANESLIVDLTGQGFDSSIVIVIDDSGNLTFNNLPQDIKGLYDQMQLEEAGAITIPGSAFPGAGFYAVGVAAMAHTSADDLDGMNTLLSGVRTGKMVMTPVVVGP